ncbi:hypothetical protein [Achromobacter denitrificans]
MDIVALLDDEEDPVGEKQVRLERLTLKEESPRVTISNEEIKDLMGVDLQAIRERAKALQEGTHAELDKVKVSEPDLEELHQEVLKSIQKRTAFITLPKPKLVPEFARKL